MEKYVNQIDTKRYGDYAITDNYFCQGIPFQRASYIRKICGRIFERQHKKWEIYWLPYANISLTDIIWIYW